MLMLAVLCKGARMDLDAWTFHMAPNFFRPCCSDGFSNSYIYYKYSLREIWFTESEKYILCKVATWTFHMALHSFRSACDPIDLHFEKQQIANTVYIRNMVYRIREIHIIQGANMDAWTFHMAMLAHLSGHLVLLTAMQS